MAGTDPHGGRYREGKFGAGRRCRKKRLYDLQPGGVLSNCSTAVRGRGSSGAFFTEPKI